MFLFTGVFTYNLYSPFQLEPFDLYPKQATVRVSLELLSQNGKATAEQIDLLEDYYAQVVVRHVLEISDVLLDFDKRGRADGPLFVPVDNGEPC